MLYFYPSYTKRSAIASDLRWLGPLFSDKVCRKTIGESTLVGLDGPPACFINLGTGGFMIKTMDQAIGVQQRRKAQGKQRLAKAVRRYLLRVDPEHYKSLRDSLPANWPDDEKERAA